jgi:hypothetical protein
VKKKHSPGTIAQWATNALKIDIPESELERLVNDGGCFNDDGSVHLVKFVAYLCGARHGLIDNE